MVCNVIDWSLWHHNLLRQRFLLEPLPCLVQLKLKWELPMVKIALLSSYVSLVFYELFVCSSWYMLPLGWWCSCFYRCGWSKIDVHILVCTCQIPGAWNQWLCHPRFVSWSKIPQIHSAITSRTHSLTFFQNIMNNRTYHAKLTSTCSGECMSTKVCYYVDGNFLSKPGPGLQHTLNVGVYRTLKHLY